MSSSSLTVPVDIKFDRAINLTQVFLLQLKNNELTSSQIQDFVTDLVQTTNGARGFLVTYLTALDPICDEPRSEIIAGLQTHPEIVAELLVKNLAMSTAQKLYHHRHNDLEMIASSLTVAARSIEIIKQLNIPQIQEISQELVNTIHTGGGLYHDFLTRWGYDEEQKNAIAQVLTQL